MDSKHITKSLPPKTPVADYVEFLLSFQYKDGDHIFHKNKELIFVYRSVASKLMADLCITTKDGQIALLVFEDMSDENPCMTVETKISTGALASFQYNNFLRSQLRLPLLESHQFPCITVKSGRIRLHKITITDEFELCVRTGQRPSFETAIATFDPRQDEIRNDEDFRTVLQWLHLFRNLFLASSAALQHDRMPTDHTIR
jgi:hypothetical protein